ncbi:MAG: hypothetical protein ACR2OJ_04240, partial [Hyphomicrobiales bacterium]
MKILDFYIKPCGLLRGRAAQEMCESGRAAALGGGDAAFTHVQILSRDKAKPEWLSCEEVQASRDTALRERMASLEMPRPPIGSFDWDV